MASDSEEQKEAGKINALALSDVAELLCLTKRQVTNLVEQGLPKHGQFHNSYYNWPEVFAWYVAFKIDGALKKQRDDREAARAGANGYRGGGMAADDVAGFEQGDDEDGRPENYNQAMLRKLVADANLTELKLSRERGEVVGVLDVERELAEVATNIRAKLLAMPGKLSPRLDAAKGKPQIKAILGKEINQVLTELARGPADGRVERKGKKKKAETSGRNIKRNKKREKLQSAATAGGSDAV